MTARARLALLGGVAVAALLLFATGADDAFRGQRFEEFLRGPWGPFAYVASMWLVQPLGLPGVLWMIPAGLIWSWPVAVGLSWVGNMGASAIAFAWSRTVAREWVAARIPPRIRAFDARLAEGGVAPVVALRLVTGQLPPADWLLGVSAVRWRAFLVGTAVGIIPGILFFVIVGSGFFAWLGQLFRG